MSMYVPAYQKPQLTEKPGHEYTKGNVKFCLAVSQTEPIKKLQAFADANQQTQGKFTIGDEKVCRFHLYFNANSQLHNVFMRVTVSLQPIVYSC